MNGRFALLLQGFAAQRHTSAGDPLRRAAERFDMASAGWKQVSIEPGWEGVSAEAASAQFAVFGQRITTNESQLRRAAASADAFNSLIDFARDAYDALPTATITQSVVDRLVAGASIVVQGVGVVSNAQELLAGLNTLASNRERAAENAVRRIQATVEELTLDVSTASSEMTVSYRPAKADDGDKRKSLRDILREYQVRDDPGGGVDWQPSGFNRWIAEMVDELPPPRRMNASEAELLDRLGPLDLYLFQIAHDSAFDVASEYFPSPDGKAGNDNHTDAFRHAYWSAILARYYGQDWSRDFTTAHEALPGNQAVREAMDLYNNEVGRQIAAENPLASDKQLADKIEEAVKDGRLVVVAPDGETLDWTDRVPIGEAGTVQEGAPVLPGKDPDDFIEKSES